MRLSANTGQLSEKKIQLQVAKLQWCKVIKVDFALFYFATLQQ